MAGAQTIPVNIAFAADTGQAKKQIRELQTQLQNLTTNSKSSQKLDLTKNIEEAKSAAVELRAILNNSVNKNTGNIDITKFTQSLRASGKSLQDYKNQFSTLGVSGDRAFASLTSAIMRAETPIRKTNGLVKELGVSLANSVKWQLSSSAIHGFMGSIQSAVGYAQALDRSLTNIQIVTGQSSDQMARFAEQANKSAQALSTTTTKYTDAALIFYQQGLGDKEVKERTDTVIKMANVTGEATEQVSSYMTAIWNNFDNGTQKLEHYSDVMTALGATTASSTKEIAGGLQQFASVAETIGLSYDYAASALATIISQTRQSESTVGNGLRTIFSRLQSVKLGDTLEDGVNLTKYTEALDKAGVKVLDMNGELRNADDILNDLADKWGQISKTQQTAIAQTVGGVRQYTNLMALMNNWDVMERNLETARKAEGSLQSQADIYADSWEAARNRVKNAKQDIYDSLIDADFFKDFDNGMADFLSTIADAIDSIGGMKGAFVLLGSTVVSIMSGQIGQSIDRMVDNFRATSKSGIQAAVNTQKEAVRLFADSHGAEAERYVGIGKDVYKNSYTQQAEAMNAIINSKGKISELEAMELQILSQENDALAEQARLSAKIASDSQKQYNRDEAKLAKMPKVVQKDFDNIIAKEQLSRRDSKMLDNSDKGWDSHAATIKELEQISELVDGDRKKVSIDEKTSPEVLRGLLERAKSQGLEPENGINVTQADIQALESRLAKLESIRAEKVTKDKNRETYSKATEGIFGKGGIDEQVNQAEKLKDSYLNLIDLAQEFKKSYQDSDGSEADGEKRRLEAIKQLEEAYKNNLISKEQFDLAMEQFDSAEGLEGLKNGISGLGVAIDETGEKFEQDKGKIIQSLEEIKKAALEGGVSADSDFIKNLDTKIEEYKQKLKVYEENMSSHKAQYEAQQDNENLERNTAQIKSFSTRMQEANISVGTLVSNTAMAVSSLTSLTTGIIGISNNIKDVLSGEKNWIKALYSSLTTMASIIPSVTFGLSGLASTAKALNMSLSGMLGAMAPVLIGVTALTVGLFGLAKALSQRNTPEKKFKRIQEGAKTASEALNEAKNKAEELEASFESYDSVLETLAECTKGTQEWKEALNEANQAVLQLISDYPKLASMTKGDESAIYRNEETGQLEIRDWAREQLISDANNQVIQNTMADNLMKEQVRRGNFKNTKNDFIQDLRPSTNGLNYSLNQDGIDLYGENITEAITDLLLNNIEDVLAANEENLPEILEGLVKNSGLFQQDYEEVGRASFQALAYNINNGSMRNRLTNMSKQKGILENQSQAADEAMASMLLANNDQVRDSKYSGELIEAGGTIYSQIKKELYDGISKEISGNDSGAKELIDSEFGEALGLEGFVGGEHKNGRFTYSYIDEEGKIEEKTVTDEYVASVVSAARAMEQFGEVASNIVDKLSKLLGSEDKGDRASGKVLASRNLSDATTGEVQDLKGDILYAAGRLREDAVGMDFSTLDDSAYRAYIEENILNNKPLDDTTASELGYETAEEVIEAYKQSIADYDKADTDAFLEKIFGDSKDNEKVIESFAEKVGESFNKIFEDFDLSNNDRNAIATALESANIEGGLDNLKALKTVFEEIGEEGVGPLASILDNIDWSQSDAVSNLNAQLEEQGIIIGEDVLPQWEAYIAQMQASQGLGEKFSALQENSILAVQYSQSKIGDEIKAKDLKSLKAIFPEIEDILATVDGDTYKFTDTMENFMARQGITLQSLIDKANEYSRIQESLSEKESGKDSSIADDFNENALKLNENSTIDDYKDVLDPIAQLEDGKKLLEEIGKPIDLIEEMIATENLKGLQETVELVQDFLNGNYDASQLAQQLGMAQTSIDSLLSLNLSGEDLSKAAINMASQYDNCTDEIQEFNRALHSGEEAAVEEAASNLELAIRAGEASEALGLEADQVESVSKEMRDMARESKKANKRIVDTEESATDAAVRFIRLNKAVQDLSKNYKTYSKTLKNIQSETSKAAKANILADSSNKGFVKSLSDLLNVSEKLISADLIDAIDPNDFQKAAEGDEEAIGRIVDSFAEVQGKIAGLTDEEISQLKEELAGLSEGEAIDLDTSSALTKLIELWLQAGLTADEIQDRLSGLSIDCDATPFIQAMDDAQAASDSVAEGAGIDAEADTITVTNKDTQQDVEFAEVVTKENIAGTVRISEDGKSKPIQYPVNMVAFSKTVTPNPVTEDAEKEQSVTGVKLSNLHKSSGGKVSSSNKGGGGSGGGGGGGGGGGSRARARRNATLKTQRSAVERNDDIERYHKIKNQLEDVSDAYDKVGKMAEKAFGKARIKLLDQQIKKQEELIKTNREYAKEIEKNLKTEKQDLGKNYGAKFDKNGTIVNYEEMMKTQIAKRNEADKKFNEALQSNYNNLSGDEQEALDNQYKEMVDEDGNNYSGYEDYLEKTIIEPAEEGYEDFKKLLEDYEDDQDAYKEKSKEILEAIYAEYDLLLQKTQYGIQLRIDFDEDSLTFLDYLKKKIDDSALSAYKGAEKIALLGHEVEVYNDEDKTKKREMSEIFSNHGYDGEEIVKNLINGNTEYLTKTLAGAIDVNTNINDLSTYKLENIGFTEDEVQALREDSNFLIEIASNLIDKRNELFEVISESYDQMLEDLDYGIERITHLQTMTTSYMNILNLVGKKRSNLGYEQLNTMLNDQVTQAQNLLAANDSKKKALAAELAETEKMYNEAVANGWTAEAEKWGEELKRQREAYEEAEEEWASSLETALEACAEAFAQSVTRIIEDLQDSLGGEAGTLSRLREQFDMSKEINSDYVEDYEKVYQLSKLTRDINKSMDETKNVRAKENLLQLQEKMNKLEENGVEFSEYRLEELRKEYELILAKNALQEAEDAKSEVRMTRDAEGNYGYVYTADQNKVAEAEQTYEDKVYELQKLNAEYINELQDNMLSLQEQAIQKMQEAADMYGQDSEEYAQALKDIQEWYSKQVEFYGSEINLAIDNNNTLYEEHVNNYTSLTGLKLQVEQEYVSSFEQTTLAIITGYQEMDEFITVSEQNINEAINKMMEAHEQLEVNIEETVEGVGQSLNTMGEDYTQTIDKMTEDSERLAESVEETANRVVENYNEMMDAARNFSEKYSDLIEGILHQNEALACSFEKLMGVWSDFEDYNASLNANEEGSEDDPNNPNGGGAGGAGGQQGSESDLVKGVAGAIWWYGYSSGWGNDPVRSQRLSEKGVSAAQGYLNEHAWNGDIYREWASHPEDLKKYYYGAFDTGGYTGEWGPEGKMAILHEKEIVLNKADTENLLQAVNLLREVNQIIDTNALMASTGVIDSLNSFMSSIGMEKEEMVVEQEVHITADFPNVSSKQEILDAFDNVINLASQYANRKNQ